MRLRRKVGSEEMEVVERREKGSEFQMVGAEKEKER